MLICAVFPSRFFNFRTVRFVSSLVASGMLLGACGYKGPLYLPKPKPEAQRSAPAPAPDAARDAPPAK